MLLEINPYSAEKCCNIVESNYATQLKNKYGNNYLVNDYRKYYTFDSNLHKASTPRLGLVTRVIPCASFYYLNYLVETHPSVIADIGCGMNFFKDIIPGIIGIDAYGDQADLVDLFDKEFSDGHTNYFDCAFSIDALHYVPISYFYNRVMEFVNIIKPGGRGYISMNVARLMDSTSEVEKIKLFNTVTPTVTQLATYIDQQIKDLTLQFLVVDNLIPDRYEEGIDGNIRIVFEK